MNFEDIVDMDWVDTNTTNNEFNDFYFDQQPDFVLEQPLTPPQQPALIEPEIKFEPLASMPTTEQIKQLIEIAKQQLALREQLQLLQQQPENSSQQPLFHPLSTTSSEIQTAAPSTIFAPPPTCLNNTSAITPVMPALSPSTITSTDMTLAPPLTTAASSAEDNSTTKSNNQNRRNSLASMPEESISLEAYAEADGIDLKKLTPKERRQLRNKISARNFRVRRKEYISTLEEQVNDHKVIAEGLKDKLSKVEEENKKLHKEMDLLKRQNQILQQQLQQKNSPSSPRISSPLPKPNLNKDLSIMGTKSSVRQQDTCILVSSAVMPVWDLESILSKQIEPTKHDHEDDYIKKLAGQFILSFVQLANTMPRETNQREDDYQLPLLPDDRDFTSLSTASIKSKSSNTIASNNTSSFYQSTSLKYMEDLYDILIQSALLNNSNADKSFLWWDQSQTL